MIDIEFECISGTARVHDSRNDGGPVVLAQGQKITLAVADFSDMPQIQGETEEEAQARAEEWVKKNFASAWNAPAIGYDRRNSAQVSATPRGCGMVIREYVETNAFLEPDKQDYVDHTVVDGEPVIAETIRSNVVTLMPTRPI